MSKMSELALDIEEMIDKGLKPVTISALLGVPLDTVYAVYEVKAETEMQEFADFGDE